MNEQDFVVMVLNHELADLAPVAIIRGFSDPLEAAKRFDPNIKGVIEEPGYHEAFKVRTWTIQEADPAREKEADRTICQVPVLK